MKEVRFFVPGKPEGYDRDAARNGATPEEVEEWRKAVRLAYKEAARRNCPTAPSAASCSWWSKPSAPRPTWTTSPRRSRTP
jgi:hypothetical protein